jgi:hypothetical protein
LLNKLCTDLKTKFAVLFPLEDDKADFILVPIAYFARKMQPLSSDRVNVEVLKFYWKLFDGRAAAQYVYVALAPVDTLAGVDSGSDKCDAHAFRR